MNIFVKMSVMRLSSEPDSILQDNRMTEVLACFELVELPSVSNSPNISRFRTSGHLPSRKKHWRPMRPSFLSAQCVDAQLAMMSVMSLIRKMYLQWQDISVLCFVGRVRFVNYESLITTMEDPNVHFVCVCL